MMWSVLILIMIVVGAPQLWSEWGFRLCVIGSLGANVVLGLLSRTRCRSTSGWRAKGRMVVVFILWGSYQVAEKATTAAIGKLTLSDSDVSEEEKQLVALWAAFLLLHLGGPDNLTAYALEDNKLSTRAWVEMFGNILGVGYAIYNYTYRGRRSWVLLAASLIIFASGVTRYIEKSYALRKANLEKMQEDASSASPGSSKEKTEECYRCRSTDNEMDQLRYRIEKKQGWELCDREALLLAQDLFPVWHHAMVDSSVMPGSSRQLASEQMLSLRWRSMCKVAEMELSLMYEMLYTKAIVAHNCPAWYYLIRFLSPLFTAAAALLFGLHQQQHGDQGIRGSFVGITYALLLVNFLLDLAWLLRALGSTWAYAYMRTQAPAWLRHQVICPGRWRHLHRLVVRVDPMQWLLCRDPASYRTWSGTIGRYNLLREAITPTTTRCLKWLDPNKEIPFLSELRPNVNRLLLQRVQKILQEAVQYKPEKDKDYAKKCYIMEDIRSKWGEKAFDLRNRKREQEHERKELFPGLVNIHADEEAPRFGKEFEEDVIAWHIATCIVLPYVRQQGVPAGSEAHAEAIAVMSEYMMFLVAVRREMLPGLVLHSLLEVTKKQLAEIWDIPRDKKRMAEVSNEDKLAKILRITRVATPKEEGEKIKGSEGTTLIWDAVNLFASLTLAGDTKKDRKDRKDSIKKRMEAKKNKSPMPSRVKRRRPVPVAELLELIFNVWVDKLVYAAVRCSRESHAKQLSAGGDLTTILWMIIQHAGPFRMGKLKDIYVPTKVTTAAPPPTPPKMEPKKEEPKMEEPKKEEPKMEEPAAPHLPPQPAWPPGPPCYDPTTTMAPTCPGFGGAPPQPPCYGWPPTTTPICPCCGRALPQPQQPMQPPPLLSPQPAEHPAPLPPPPAEYPAPPSPPPAEHPAPSPLPSSEFSVLLSDSDALDTVEYNTKIEYYTF